MNNDLNHPKEYPDQTGKYWELFNHLANEHGITLLDEEMDQIKIICDRLNQPDEGIDTVTSDHVTDDMLLPVGHTCGDCFHLPRCKGLFGIKGYETTCDFSPSRFYVVTPDVKPIG